jgi:hypothetical protein
MHDYTTYLRAAAAIKRDIVDHVDRQDRRHVQKKLDLLTEIIRHMEAKKIDEKDS